MHDHTIPMQNVPAHNHGHQPPELTKHAQTVMENVDFLPGEALQFYIQGDGYFLGSNPLLKAVAKMQAFMTTLTGGHIRVFIMVTNQRLLLVESRQMYCGVMRVRGIQAIALASVLEAGWNKETQACCIHTRVVHMQSRTQRHTLVIQRLTDQQLREFTTQLSGVMVQNAERGYS